VRPFLRGPHPLRLAEVRERGRRSGSTETPSRRRDPTGARSRTRSQLMDQREATGVQGSGRHIGHIGRTRELGYGISI